MIPVADPEISISDMKHVLRAMKDGWVSSRGPYVEEFEREFSILHDGWFATSCCNGTAALHMALFACGVQKGDEIIVPSFTFYSTASAVEYCGAKPIFVDVEPFTWCMNPEEVKRKVTDNTRAIIPVHLYGHPCNMDAIKDVLPERVYIIEDCAEALGALYKGKKVGTLGDIGIFSFFANKVVTTGEGGMCITYDSFMDERLRAFKDYGRIPGNSPYMHHYLGYNYRMGSLQAALGTSQLKRLDSFIDKRHEIFLEYEKWLSGIKGLVLPPWENWASPICWMFTIRIKNGDIPHIIAGMRALGVDTRPGFIPVHKQPPFLSKEFLPVTESLAEECITLPCYTKMTMEDVKTVCDSLKKVLNG